MSFTWTGTPETLAWYAANLEAYRAMNANPVAGSPQDYALWSAGGYSDTADRLVRDMPVWEA